MKKVYCVFTLMLAIILMSGCDSLNPSERLMVGKWYSTLNDDSSDVNTVAEQTDEYREDKTFVSKLSWRHSWKIGDSDIYYPSSG